MLAATLAQLFGFSESLVTYLFGLLLTLPFAFVFQRFVLRDNVPSEIRHTILLVAGFFFGYYLFSVDIRYPLMTGVTNYMLFQTSGNFPPKSRSRALYFIAVANFLYLLFLYWVFQSDHYDSNFLTPQSILCLQYIGFALDLLDSTKDPKAYPNALKAVPPYVEFMAFSFSPFSLLVGPLIPFAKFKAFIEISMEQRSKLLQIDSQQIERIFFMRALRDFPSIFFGLAISIGGSYLFPRSCILTDDPGPFLFYLINVVGFGFQAMSKYIVAWMIICCAGNLAIYMDYSEVHLEAKSPNDRLPETCLRNIFPYKVFTVCSLKDLISVFNIRTNAWGRFYLFKRFAPFGNKIISAFLTITLLCIWHGFHTAYYLVFAVEFMILVSDTELEKLLGLCHTNKSLLQGSLMYRVLDWYHGSMVGRCIRGTLMKIYMGISLAHLELLTVDRICSLAYTIYLLPFILLAVQISIFYGLGLYLCRVVTRAYHHGPVEEKKSG